MNGTWANATDFIIVRNDGNVGVNVTIQSNKQNGNDSTNSFICQNNVGGCGAGLESNVDATQYNYKTVTEESGVCTYETSGPFTLINTNYEFCDFLKSGDNEDEIKIALQVGIPADAQGQKSSTITFTSTAAGENGC